jgi:hypothetical protein
VLTHLQRPLTRRYRAELIGHDLDPLAAGPGGGEEGRPRHLGGNAIFAVAFLLSAVLVGLATVALR